MNEDISAVLDNLTHEQVVRAAVATYDPSYLTSLGLHVTTNIGTSNTRRNVGPVSDPLYPDIILWKLHTQFDSVGKAVSIEQIETTKSIERNAALWPKFVNTGIEFTLRVPVKTVPMVQQKLSQLGIAFSTILKAYTLNQQTGQYEFVAIE